MAIRHLETIRPHIYNLEIFIEVEDMYQERDETLAAAQVLLRPFRRLRNVFSPWVRSVICSYHHGPNLLVAPTLKIFFPDPMNPQTEADIGFENYLSRWKKELSGGEPAPELSAIPEAYWKLEKLLQTIQSQQGSRCLGSCETFDSILYAAKVAREAGDLARFREAWDQLVNLWFDYVNQQDQVRENVSKDIDSIYKMISRQTNTRPPQPFSDEHSRRRLDDIPDLDDLDATHFLTWTDDQGMMYTSTGHGTTLQLLTPMAVGF
jgi:hypothetical protein